MEGKENMMSTATRRRKGRGRLWAISASGLGVVGLFASVAIANAADGDTKGVFLNIVGGPIPDEFKSIEVTVTNSTSGQIIGGPTCVDIPQGAGTALLETGLQVTTPNEFASYQVIDGESCQGNAIRSSNRNESDGEEDDPRFMMDIT